MFIEQYPIRQPRLKIISELGTSYADNECPCRLDALQCMLPYEYPRASLGGTVRYRWVPVVLYVLSPVIVFNRFEEFRTPFPEKTRGETKETRSSTHTTTTTGFK